MNVVYDVHRITVDFVSSLDVILFDGHTMGCERTMVGVVLCAMSAFLLAQSAPTSLKSSNEAFMTADELTSHEKPLVRS